MNFKLRYSYFRLAYDREKHVTTNSPGVDIKIPGWGDTKTIEWLDPTQTCKYMTLSINSGK